MTDLPAGAIRETLRPEMTEIELSAPMHRAFMEEGGALMFHFLGATPMDEPELIFPWQYPSVRPIRQGWLRALHRKLDEAKSRPWRPYHSHDRRETLEPSKAYALDIEIWPTSIVIPAGYC